MAIEKISTADVSAKLRALRRSRGWSLLDVEAHSHGRLKAVVLGSYERGSRSLSVKRAIEIAEIYEIPLSQLFTDKKISSDAIPGRKMFDLRTISNRAQIPNEWSERFTILARYTRAIVESRQDWNGEVLSLRGSDCATLAMILNIDSAELLQWLDDEKVILAIRH
jgi:transcriptional regulator with XRE-family HTH domain